MPTTVFCLLAMLSVLVIIGPTITFGRSLGGQITRHYAFNVEYHNFTRLCHTKTMPTVNGQFPGPTISAHEGDRLVIKVTNRLNHKNITIHWHGVKQLRSGWFDGPAYITQCPIQPNHTYTYNFTLSGQRGTLFWHAHISWMRATVHGAIVILPKLGKSYPFQKPAKEVPIVLGEWWNADVEKIIKQALKTGGGPNISDAYTINGLPGALYNCSRTNDTFHLPVVSNQTYLLRIINAALNAELFFSVANHKMTIVEVDASYTKPHKTDILLIAPGQTTNVLLTANQPKGKYYIAARPYKTGSGTLDNTTTTAILEYVGENHKSTAQPTLPNLPGLNDTSFAMSFSSNLRSLHSKDHPAKVPTKIDRNLFFTVGLARKSCPQGRICQGASGGKFAAAINNISFSLPTISLLQAYYFNISGVFTTDFPDNPPSPFNYTGPQPNNLTPRVGTKITRMRFNSSVELILQDTSILGVENHPIHLHGYNFYVVGQGFGNYNSTIDPKTFNLVDPLERNTVAVPAGGWAALRFLADNPGIWFLHCHLEVHTSWGLDMAFLVENGHVPNQSLMAPPLDLPSC